MKMKTDPAFMKTVENNVERFLVAAGTYGVSAAVILAPVRTGLYRNSIMYKTSGGKSGNTGSMSGATGGGKVSAPDQKKTVRVGSGVEYAEHVEKKHGTMAASYDALRRNLDRLAQAVMKA